MSTNPFDEFQRAAPANPFDEFQAVGPAPRAVLKEAVKQNPDEYGEAQRLAKRYPAPVDVLARNLQDFRLQEAVDKADERLKTSPKLQVAMRDAKLARLAHDDIESLAKIESGMALTTVASAAQAVLGIGEGVWRTPDAAQRAVGAVADAVEWTGFPRALNPVRGLQDFIRLVSEGQLPTGQKFMSGTTDVANMVNDASKLLADDTQTFGAGFKDAQTLAQNADRALSTAIKTGQFQQAAQVLTDPQYWTAFIGQALPSLALALRSGGSTAFMAWMEGMEQASNAAEFEQRTGIKISDAEFTQAVAQTALVNALLEKYGVDKVLGAPGKGLKGVGQAILGEGGTEGAQQLNSNLAALLAYNPEQSLSEGVLASVMGGAGSGGAMATTQAAVQRVAEKADTRQRQIRAAQEDADRLAGLLQTAAGSALRERSPEDFRALMQTMTDGKVYVDGEVLNQLPADVKAALPEAVQAQIAQESPISGMVELSVADVLTVAPGTPLEQVLVENVRTDPFAMSLADAKVAGEKAAALLETEKERALAQAADQGAARASSEAVKANLLGQLKAGDFKITVNGITRPLSDAQAEGFATWATAFYTTMGARTGMTAEEFYAKFPLRVNDKPSKPGEGYNAQRPGEITVEGYHFSKADRPVLSTAFYGTGLRGSARDEIMASPDQRLRQRLSFYFDKGTGVRPEDGVGGRAHRVQLTGVYDADADPLKLKTGDARAFEAKLLDLGYKGYANRMEGTQPGQVIMLGNQTFRPELLGAQSQIQAGQKLEPIKAEVTWQTQASGTPEQLQARLERMQSNPAWAGYDLRIEGNQLQVRPKQAEGVLEQSVSTRLPTGKKATENPLAEQLVIGFDTVKRNPTLLEKFATRLDAIKSLKTSRSKDPAKRIESYIGQMVDNLLWLHDQVPAEIRNRSKLWYDGARAIVDRWVDQYDGRYTDVQLSAVLAVMSPKMDWFTNVTLGERIVDIWDQQQNFTWSAEMTTAAEKTAIVGYAEQYARIQGKTLAELNSEPDANFLQALWLVAYDRAYNPKEFRVVTPEGDFADLSRNGSGSPAKAAWGNGFGPVAKAIAVLKDGSIANVSGLLGNAHKVRNFYNNIFAPKAADGSVTADTHAVAAALLSPLSQTSPEVEDNFGAAGNDINLGISGTYPIYAEAYRRAAEQRGILPREMQSITWEAVRGLFSPAFKAKYKANKKAFDAIWKDFYAGNLDIDQARQRIVEFADGISNPDWYRPGDAGTADRWSASYAGELLAPGGVGGTTGAGARTDAAAGTATLAQAGDLTDGRPQQAGDGAGRYSSGSLAPLEGAPTVEGATGPDPRLVAVAEQYALEVGIDLRRQGEYVKVDPERAARIAAAYEAMEHAPNDPRVKEAYENLAQQTLAQYLALQRAGYVFYLVDETNDPYAGNPWNAMRDLRANQRMGVFATEAGFGTSDFDPEGNPLLADTGLEWGYGSPDGPKKRVLFNDLFRAVHDAFGHGLEGAGFRAQGEENAWQAHVRLFTGSAVGAITSETRGQNSWLNYGPHGEANRTAKVEDTIFADQKTGLMPEWTWTEGRAPDEGAAVDQTQTPEFKAWFGDSKVVDAEGRPLVVYHGTPADFDVFGGKPVDYVRGFFFSDMPGATPAAMGPGTQIMPVYLSIKKPLVVSSDILGDVQREYEELKRAKQFGYDGLMGKTEAGETIYVAMRPEQIKSAIGNNGNFDPNSPSILKQSAYHGTPYRGIDKFDTGKIGTGEGNQSFGWGLYFTSLREIAEGYRKDISRRRASTNPEYRAALEELEDAFRDADTLGFDSLREAERAYRAEPEAYDLTPEQRQRIDAAIEREATLWAELSKGQVYQVDVPENDELLIWDKPLGEQSEKVRAALAAEQQLYRDSDGAQGAYINDVNGEQIYREFTKAYGSEKAASLRLLELGIKGTNYPAGTMSGVKNSKGRNFVIFSGDDVAIQGQFYQRQQTTARGTFSPATLELVLNPNADLSTFFHETGHFFLEVLADVGTQPGSPLAEDWAKVLKWANVTQEQWDQWQQEYAASGYTKISDGLRALHERWAESVEQYVMEGKAPSAELQPLMRKFATWLKSVYRSIQQFLAARGQAPATGGEALNQTDALEQAKEDFADFDPLTDPDKPPYEGAKKRNGNWVSRDGNFTAYPTGGYGARVVSNRTAEFLDKHGFGGSHLNLFGIQIFEALEAGRAFTDAQARLVAELTDLGVEDAQDEVADFVRQAVSALAPDNLKKWFGNSKIVDDEGKPLVVYHGTSKDFAEFKGGRFPGTLNDIGFWFSNEPADASAFARGEGARVMPVYLRIERPLYIDSAQELAALWKEHTGSDNFRTGAEAFKAWAESAGYDGVALDGKDIDPSFAKGSYLVAFRSEQIKSAIGNDGTYDGSDPSTLSQDPAAQPGPQLNDDIRRVMDRLLATDEQIAQANEIAGLLPDMDADAEAAERLNKRSIADLKWAVKARDKVIAKLRKQAREIEKTIREEVTAEVNAMPEVQAKAALDALKVSPEHKALIDEWKARRAAAETAEQERLRAELLAANPDAKGLAKGQLLTKAKREMANKIEAYLIQWDRDNPKPARPVGTMDAEMAVIADSFGYPSVDSMLQAIDAFGSKQDAIDGLTEKRMLEEHGDLVDERAIRDAANEAVHNEARARSLATELRSQREMLNVRADTGETNAKGSKITVNVLVEAAKQFGAQVVARTALRDLRAAAWRHTAAERRAGARWQEATAAGQTEEAVKAKQDQVLQNAAAKAAVDAQAEAKKILEFFKRVTKGNDEKVVEKGRDADIVNAARAVLAAYGVQTATTKTADAYLEAVKRNDPDTYAVIAPMVEGATRAAQPLDALTFEELQTLHEDVAALWHLAKVTRQMEVDGNKMDIEDAADELRTRMAEIGVPDTVPGETGALTAAEERARWLQFAGALLRRVEQWAERMDGKFGGPFLRLVFQPIKDAATRYKADHIAYRAKFQALVDNIAPMMTAQLIEAPELNYTFGKGHNGIGHAELLHAILHTGNDSNKRKLLLGRKWATENPDGTLDTSRWDSFINRLVGAGVLQREHFDFAQSVWDLMEETKPLAQQAHRDVFGRYFAEVTADSFTDPFGVTRRGGYVPAQADPAIVSDASIRALAEMENENMAYSFPTTSKGFTKARVEYNRPLKLDLRTLPMHIDKVLLFSHMEPAVRGVSRLLRDKAVSYGLTRLEPAAYEGMLLPWLNRSARQQVETPVVGDGRTAKILSVLRARAGAAIMFANVSNTLQQITGLSSAAVKVKPGHLMKAAAQMIAHPKQTFAAVAAASEYMRTRMDNSVAEMDDTIKQVLTNPGVYERAQDWTRRHAYFLQQAFDNTLSPIVWTGAYNDALAQGMDERMAVRFADGVVRQTQGALAAEDVSRIETGPAYARIFTQFASYWNMLGNTNLTALQQISSEMGVPAKSARAFYIVTMGFLVPVWVAEAIALGMKGGPGDADDDGDKDDLVDWLASVLGMGTIKGLLAQVPFVGQLANAAVARFNTNPADDRMSLSPVVGLLEAAAGVPSDVYKAATGEVNARTAVRDVAALVSVATGLPAYAVARPLGYAAGVAQDKIDPTGPVDAVRGAITGTASPESKQR